MLYVPSCWWKMLDRLESYIVYNLKSRIGCTVCSTITYNGYFGAISEDALTNLAGLNYFERRMISFGYSVKRQEAIDSGFLLFDMLLSNIARDDFTGIMHA